MTLHRQRPEFRQLETENRPAIRLLRDETGATTLEYVVAAVALALAAIAASRVVAGLLAGYLHHVYMVAAIPVL